MTARRNPGPQRLPPSIRYAPIGEIEIYEVERKELEQLASGSTAALFLNFSLFLLGIAATLTATLLSTTIPSPRVFYGFLNLAALTWISGLVLLALWWRDHSKSRDLLDRIINRMPAPPSPQQESSGRRRREGPGPGRKALGAADLAVLAAAHRAIGPGSGSV